MEVCFDDDGNNTPANFSQLNIRQYVCGHMRYHTHTRTTHTHPCSLSHTPTPPSVYLPFSSLDILNVLIKLINLFQKREKKYLTTHTHTHHMQNKPYWPPERIKIIEMNNLIRRFLEVSDFTIGDHGTDILITSTLSTRLNEKYRYSTKEGVSSFSIEGYLPNPFLEKITSKDISQETIEDHRYFMKRYGLSSQSDDTESTTINKLLRNDQDGLDRVVREMKRLGAVFPKKIVSLCCYGQVEIPKYISAFLQSWTDHPPLLYETRQHNNEGSSFNTLCFGQILDERAPFYEDMVLIGQEIRNDQIIWIYADIQSKRQFADFPIYKLSVNAKTREIPREFNMVKYPSREKMNQQDTISNLMSRYSSEETILKTYSMNK